MDIMNGPSGPFSTTVLLEEVIYIEHSVVDGKTPTRSRIHERASCLSFSIDHD